MCRRSSFVLMVALVSLLSACGGPDSALTDPAEAFFDNVANDDIERAHRYLSQQLASRTPVDGLDAFLRYADLRQPGERDWKNASSEGNRGSLEGEIQVGSEEQAVPVRLNLLKEDMHWRIDGIARGVRVAVNGGQVLMFAPSESESSRMAQQTTAQFADAVRRNDLSGFWNGMAEVFRMRYTAEQFSEAMGGFVRDKVNLGAAAKLTPRFSAPPTIEPNGELVMSGVFPTRPSEVVFEYRYLNENNAWINSGISINLVPRG